MNSPPPSTPPLISVIIPHLNQPDGLAACLKSLDAQTLDHAQFEVLVVDNGSVSRPDKIIANHPRTRLLEEPEPGPGPARNRGVQAAQGSILAFIDADCLAHPDWLLTAQREAIASGENTVLGGAVPIWLRDPPKYTYIEAFESAFAYDQKDSIERHHSSGTANLVVWRTTFYKVGPFGGISIPEDHEWGQRACTVGFKLRYVPGMIVFHPARPSLRDLHAQWDRYTQQAFNLARNTRFWQIRCVVGALIAFASPVLLIPKVIGTQHIQGLSTRLKAWLVLVAVKWRRGGMMLSLMRSNRGVVWNRDTEVKSSP
jgi:glycosyltransferase involved in cell wall biosynthesis